MKKIRSFFKEVFSNRKTKLMFCTVVLSFILLIGITFSWFISIIELPQNEIKTGTIEVVCKAYDENGEFISLLGNYEEFLSKDENKNLNTYFTPYKNVPLFNIDNWSANSATTVYISLENSGTLDIDYSLSFVVNGMAEDLKNIGGYWYRVEKIKDEYLAYDKVSGHNHVLGDNYHSIEVNYSNVIKNYIETTNDKLTLCSNDCGKVNEDGSTTKCNGLQHDLKSRNLVTINHFSEQSSLPVDGGRCIYKIDLGLRSECIDPRYTSAKFSVSGEIYATQKGAIANPDGLGATFTVTDELTFKNALDNALPGDTIVLGNEIKFDGDLIFNKAVNLNTYGNDLTVNGNLIFNFVSKHTLKINMSGGGNIYVNKVNEFGGDLEINAPNSEVIITGNNFTTNIYVADIAYFNVTNAEDTDGLLINGANILNSSGYPKDIDIDSNSKITVSYGCSLANIEAVSNSSNITIINYGTIGTIYLAKMLYLDSYPDIEGVDTQYPQINIQNYNKIEMEINTPTWVAPFYDIEYEDGYKHGNTLIVRHLGAQEMKVLENERNFKNKDIIDHNIRDVSVVQEVPGKNDSLIIYYGDYEKQETSIEFLLTEYFEEETGTSGTIISEEINKVRKLKVITLKEKEISADDLIYFNKMASLEVLDMSMSKVFNNTIPAKAFYQKSVLKEVDMPDTITTVGSQAFSETGIKKLVVPASVTSYEYNSWNTITYIFHESLIPVKPNHTTEYFKYSYPNQFIFVHEASISDYRITYNNDYSTYYYNADKRIYPMGEITDDGQHVVRKISNGYELVCYTGEGGEIRAGFNLTLNNQEIKITSIGEFCYSNVKTEFNLTFDASVTNLANFAFFNSPVRNIDFNEVRYVGDYTFYNCLYITELNTKKVETIGRYAFAHSENIFRAEFPNLISIDSYAFQYARYLTEVAFYKIQTISPNAFNHYLSNKGYTYSLYRIYFYNDNFDNVNYSSLVNVEIPMFRVFVHPYLVDDFRATGCVDSKLVCPIGDVVGEQYIGYILEINGSPVEYKINLGEYVVSKEEDNVDLICYNATNITEDFEVPGIAEVKNEDGTITVKKITKVRSYAFHRIKFEGIDFTFADSIIEVEDYLFNGHSSENHLTEDKTYYNRIENIDFNNVEILGKDSCRAMLKLQTVNAPKLKVIRENTFKICPKLHTVNFPSVEEVYAQAFYNCTKLFHIELPSVKKMMGDYIFRSCLDLVSITLGPNLEVLDVTDFITGDMTRMRELIIQSNYVITKKFMYLYYSNPDFKMYIPWENIDSQYSDYRKFYRELGYKCGDYEISNSDGTLKFNIGAYTVKDVNLYDKNGLSISSYNYEIGDVPTNYKLPESLEGKDVIRIGYRSYFQFPFGTMDIYSYDHGENFAFSDNLLEIGEYAFYDSYIRVSNFKNVKSIDQYAFYSCDNMYLVNAPELLYIGAYGFYGCVNIHNFDAKKLYEIKLYALDSLTNLKQLLTNIQIAEDTRWLSRHDAILISFATEENAVLSGVNFPKSYNGTLKLSSAAMTKIYTDAGDMIKCIDDITLAEKIEYEVLDGNGEVIYTFDTYRYAINRYGDYVTIIKCLTTYGIEDEEEYMVPNILDNRVVTTIGAHAYRGRYDLVEMKLSFGNNIKNIDNYAFYNMAFTGVLDFNNVEYIGAQAFQNVMVESIIGKKVTSIGSSNFISNLNLVSVYFDSLSEWGGSLFSGCTNLKYIYTESLMAIGNDNKYVKSGITFVINKEVEKLSDIQVKNWNAFNNITICVPYNSLEFYKTAFSDTNKYVNFNIQPIGTIAIKANEETGTNDLFVLVEIEDEYNIQTGEYEKSYEIISIITQNPHIIIPEKWESSTNPEEDINITRLNKDTFKGQNTILSITLPRYLSSHNDLTFVNAESLQDIFVDVNNLNYSSDNGVLYSKDYSELICYPKNHKGENYITKDQTILIRSNAFKDCYELKNVVISSELKYIGSNAFDGTILETIEFKTEVPPIASGSNVFDVENKDLIIYVPMNAENPDIISNYKKVSAFKNYIILSK